MITYKCLIRSHVSPIQVLICLVDPFSSCVCPIRVTTRGCHLVEYAHPPTDLTMEPTVDKFTVEFGFQPDEAYLYRLHCWRLYEPAIVLIVDQALFLIFGVGFGGVGPGDKASIM